jgi:hypothetical protein
MSLKIIYDNQSFVTDVETNMSYITYRQNLRSDPKNVNTEMTVVIRGCCFPEKNPLASKTRKTVNTSNENEQGREEA